MTLRLGRANLWVGFFMALQFDRESVCAPALQGQALGRDAAVAAGMAVALQLATDGDGPVLQLPCDGPYAVVLLPQAGKRHTSFRL